VRNTRPIALSSRRASRLKATSSLRQRGKILNRSYISSRRPIHSMRTEPECLCKDISNQWQILQEILVDLSAKLFLELCLKALLLVKGRAILSTFHHSGHATQNLLVLPNILKIASEYNYTVGFQVFSRYRSHKLECHSVYLNFSMIGVSVVAAPWLSEIVFSSNDNAYSNRNRVIQRSSRCMCSCAKRDRYSGS
jgi:hypothetical protein